MTTTTAAPAKVTRWVLGFQQPGSPFVTVYGSRWGVQLNPTPATARRDCAKAWSTRDAAEAWRASLPEGTTGHSSAVFEVTVSPDRTVFGYVSGPF